jgi:hypothetical protein
MTEKEKVVTLKVPEGGWVTFNDSQTGLYRCHYPSSLLDRLAHAAEQKVANPQVSFTYLLLILRKW